MQSFIGREDLQSESYDRLFKVMSENPQNGYSKDEIRRFIVDFLMPEFNKVKPQDAKWSKETDDIIKDIGIGSQKNKKESVSNFMEYLLPKMLAEHQLKVT